VSDGDKSVAMILDVSVIIPALNAAQQLPKTLASCAGAREIIIVDGGSCDETVAKAAQSGARVLISPRGRGIQLQRGALQARGQWLLFLHADTVLRDPWREAVRAFIAEPANRERAATFQFALDDPGPRARRLERAVAWRVRALGLPYGDQGLLVHRAFYHALGGFPAWPLMEDVELVRRIGRRRLCVLGACAHTSAERWQREGWHRRSGRNLGCLALYFIGVPPKVLAKLYGR
jgi:rSAM/selenodomain-associated transferase 2